MDISSESNYMVFKSRSNILFVLIVGAILIRLFTPLILHKTSLSWGLVIAAAMMPVILPWTDHNYQLTGSVTPLSLDSGLLLMQGNNDMTAGISVNESIFDPLENLEEADKSTAFWKIGMDWIKGNPGKFFKLVPLKIIKFFSPLERANKESIETRLAPIIYILFIGMYLFSLYGLVTSFKDWCRWLILYFLILYSMGLSAIFLGDTRYGLVVQPFICILAGTGIVHIFSLFQRRRCDEIIASLD